MSPFSAITVKAAVAVAAGASLGAWLRWLFSLAFNPIGPRLPLGTLAANLVGGLLIGVALEVFERLPWIDPAWRLFAVTGFLGGLTTFSTFSGESLTLLMRGDWGGALLHSATHLLGALVAAGAGLALTRWILG